MYKIKFAIIFISFSLYSCIGDFQKLPEKYQSDEELLKKILPNQKIQYWQVDYVMGFTPEKKFSSGNQSLADKIQVPKSEIRGGFFFGCQPLYCYYRILYLKNNTWYHLQDANELKNFIGDIDNEYEAFLIARINDYDIDSDYKANRFIKTDSGYKLKVMKYENCPESMQGFQITILNNGKIEYIKDLGFYYKSKDCIVY